MSVLMGVIGGIAGAAAMDTFSAGVARARGGREAPGAAPGSHRSARGVQPAQAAGRAEDDATVRAASAVFHAATGREPHGPTRRLLGTLAHYAFGAAAGAVYVVAARHLPALRAGFGTLYGTLVWAAADESVMPALGLSRGPRDLRPEVHAYALAGHFAYGAALEGVLRLPGREVR